MKYIIILFLMNLAPLTAQSTKETFVEAIANAKNDSIRSQFTIQLCKSFYQQNSDSARYYAQKGLERIEGNTASWAQKNKGDFMNIIAVTYYFDNKLNKADKAFREVAAYNRRIGYESGEADALSNLAAIFSEQKLIDSCVVYDLKALSIREKINSPKIAISYNNLGLSYKDLRMYSIALSYYKKAILAKQKTQELKGSLGNTYLNIANIYKIHEEWDSAHIYYDKALDIAKSIEDNVFIGQTLCNIGDLYMDEGKYELATPYLKNAYQTLINYDSFTNIVPVLQAQGRLGIFTKNYSVAKEKLELGLTLLKERGLFYSYDTELIMDYLENLYWSMGNEKMANYYEKEARGMMDSLNFRELQEKSHQILLELDNERKEAQIGRLEKETEIQYLRNENLIYQRAWFISASFLLALFAGLLFWGNRWRARTNKQLKALNDTKDKLFSIIAHDLKNPLSAFRSITQSLSEDISEIEKEDLQYFMNSLNRSASSLFELLENLLYWAISQSGQLEFHPHTLSLHKQSEKAITVLQNNIQEKGLVVENKIAPNIEVFADSKMLDTIIRNLLTNAIKFTPSGGKISLDAHLEKNWICYSVRDTGIGIAAQWQATLFQINTEVSNRNEIEGKGTGLGLILCKELVERHCGKIWVESTLGEGAVFYFTLPANQAKS